MDNQLTLLLAATLGTSPGKTARELSVELISTYGALYHKSNINRVLYSNPRLFLKSRDAVPRWSLRDVHAPSAQAPPAVTRVSSQSFDLWPWQRRALDAWYASNFEGVIEAVTGTGKSLVGLAAAANAVKEDLPTVVLVPTIELQLQWVRLVGRFLPSLTVGLLGNGHMDSLNTCDILVATAQTACVKQLVPPGVKALLIADECHRYGSANWRAALEPGFPLRLGLTATYERQDDGVAEILDPYFGGVCYSLDYEEALADSVISPFKIAIVRVPLSPTERRQYDEFGDEMRRARTSLVNQFGIPAEPFGTFMRRVSELARGHDLRARGPARHYLRAFSQRREVLSGCQGKFDAIWSLRIAVRTASRAIVFTQTVTAAYQVIALLKHKDFIDEILGTDISGAALNSTLSRITRRQMLDAFARGDHKVIAAPRLLDEGVDVPEADLGIIVQSSQSRIQMIQRMGRVIRKKADGRCARVVILCAEGTSEDPAQGGHEAFLDVILPHAKDVTHFAPGDVEGLSRYLRP